MITGALVHVLVGVDRVVDRVHPVNLRIQVILKGPAGLSAQVARLADLAV
jgi:hypothetical protein